jgi:hypothetical protein
METISYYYNNFWVNVSDENINLLKKTQEDTTSTQEDTAITHEDTVAIHEDTVQDTTLAQEDTVQEDNATTHEDTVQDTTLAQEDTAATHEDTVQEDMVQEDTTVTQEDTIATQNNPSKKIGYGYIIIYDKEKILFKKQLIDSSQINDEKDKEIFFLKKEIETKDTKISFLTKKLKKRRLTRSNSYSFLFQKNKIESTRRKNNILILITFFSISIISCRLIKSINIMD